MSRRSSYQKPIDIPVPSADASAKGNPTIMRARNPAILPYVEAKPVVASEIEHHRLIQTPNPRRFMSMSEDRTADFLSWIERMSDYGQVIQVTYPFASWKNTRNVEARLERLQSPDMKALLCFTAGKNFNYVIGQPYGTAMVVLNDEIYRCLTWRSITQGKWNGRSDGIISHKNLQKNQFTHYLWKLKSANQGDLKEVIISTIGATLLERDKPEEEALV